MLRRRERPRSPKAAHLALKALGLPNALDGTYQLGGVHPETLVLASAEDETSASA